MQLPATILSDKAKTQHYDRSLFERLLHNGHAYTMLNVQYRMTPAIAAFPAKTFYHGELHNGRNVREPGYCPPYIYSDSTAENMRRINLGHEIAQVQDTFHTGEAPSASLSSSSSNSETDRDFQPRSSSMNTSGGPSQSYLSYTGPPLLSSCIFFDVYSRETESGSSSKSNPQEADFCIKLL